MVALIVNVTCLDPLLLNALVVLLLLQNGFGHQSRVIQ